jgi:hypothetical protein
MKNMVMEILALKEGPVSDSKIMEELKTIFAN